MAEARILQGKGRMKRSRIFFGSHRRGTGTGTKKYFWTCSFYSRHGSLNTKKVIVRQKRCGKMLSKLLSALVDGKLDWGCPAPDLHNRKKPVTKQAKALSACWLRIYPGKLHGIRRYPMKTNRYLTDFYNNYDEDSRHGKAFQSEFPTTMHIWKIHKARRSGTEIGAGTGRYSHALATSKPYC